MRTYLLFLFYALLCMACSYSQDNKASDPVADTQAEKDFQEPHRPQFHFTPPSMWMNDPNGMVYLNGEYHLFYQHYPDSTVWGPMHWGHAVSKDLIHWEHLPIALYPDSLGYIFSGSAVADVNNTSGLGTQENPPLVAIYTYHDAQGAKAGRNDYQTQGIAFSVDHGRSWEKYTENPVLKNPGIQDFRDPKVFWHEDSKQWVMILAVADHVELYGAPDLKQWRKLSEFGKNHGAHGGVWECPDLFPMKVEGQDTEKWVMLLSINPGGLHGGSATQYFIGDFDGKTFTTDQPADSTLWIDYGKDNYAGVTWSNVPDNDGRRIFMGWMSNWQYANVVPTSPWRSAMTIPRVLTLGETAQGLRVFSQPVKELEVIRGETTELKKQDISESINITEQLSFPVTTSELVLTFEGINSSQDFGVEFSNAQGQKLRIGYQHGEQKFYVDRSAAGKQDFSADFAGIHTAPRMVSSNTVKMHILTDVASVELFADDGSVVITDIFFPEEDFNQLTLYSEGGAVQLASGSVTALQSIWKETGTVQNDK